MATTKITNPDLFELESLNTALRLPSGSTQQRPANPSTGEWRYNTTTNLVEYYDGGSWRELVSEDIPPIPSENFNTVLYTGNGSTQSITGVGFKPDVVWIKDRTRSREHILCDTSRGSEKELTPNTDDAEENRGVYSFDTDGFTFNDGNTNYNDNGESYVAWCFKANGGTTSSNTDGSATSTVQVNTKAGFSIAQMTFAGTGSIGHGLGKTPNVVILKGVDAVESWQIYSSALGTGKYLSFSKSGGNSAVTTRADSFSTVNSTIVTNEWTGGTVTWIMYSFVNTAGYSSSGTYTGNGSTTGPIVNTGFEPAFLMVKRTDSSDNWIILDNKRSTSNPRINALFPNLNSAELTSGFSTDFLTNGFQIKTTDNSMNNNGGTYFYWAFASDPSAAPVLADSFANKLYTGDSNTTQSITGLGFQPNLIWQKSRSTNYSNFLMDSVRGRNSSLISNSTAANNPGSSAGNDLVSFDTDGFTMGPTQQIYGKVNGVTYVTWNWKANPIPSINTDGTIQSVVSANQASGFSIVKYTGTFAAATVGHGLSSAPEMVIVKNLDSTTNWWVWNADLGGGDKYLKLNGSDAVATATSIWDGTVPTSTVFSVANDSGSNGSGNQILAYCFYSVSGYSKIGTYTGNASSNSITGLGFQPNWVMIKRTDSANGWNVFDSARGAGMALFPNLTNAEANNTANFVSFDSDGFSLASSGGDTNASGGTYLYMAFKENPAQPVIPSGYMAYLVVAGGGSGHRSDSNNGAGGGGAGGLRSSYVRTGGGGTVESNITLTAKTYTITIGAGGADNSTSGGPAISGSNSVLDTITSVGGGGGGGVGLPAEASTSGGSGGGGGGYNSGAGAAGTTNQGFAGGNGSPSTSGTFSERNGGGGGGAGSVGVTGSTSSAGQGGFGVIVPITGTNVGYAGGGSGGNKAGSGISSTSGGGTGAGTNGIGTSGAVNTGGGGGGGGVASYAGKGGGSGVVILRMNTSDYSGTTTGSPTVTTIGSETILTYTGSGTYVHS